MDNGLYNALVSKANNGKTIYQSWRELFQEKKDPGTIRILQLFIDMTGFGYRVVDTDLTLLMQDDPHLLDTKIITASFQTRDIFQNGIFLANFNKFWQHIIVHQWKELLSGNDWFNKSVMLVILLCQSKSEECAMVGSLICANLVPHLCAARQNLLNDMQRVACRKDNQRKSSLKKKEYYIDQVCQALMPEISNGFKYSKLSNLLMEKLCEMYVSYPDLLILTYGQIELLGTALMWKNRQSVQLVLKCLKQLISDSFSDEINNAAGIFILKTERELTRIMDSYKRFEPTILHLFLEALSTVGNIPLCEDTAEKIIHKMFSSDETVVNAAIDLHGIFYASIHPPAEVEANSLIAILDVFKRYTYPLASFEAVIKKLWIKGFFRKFDGLFEMVLNARDTQSDGGFTANCIAHTISYCHQLLMEDIRTKISPALRPSDLIHWNFIRKRIQSFVTNFPKCLNAASHTPNIYNLLLNCMNPENNELYRMAEVDCEAYHEEVLFNILSKIALNESSYSVLFQTLTTIYSFDTIAHISEDVWNELTEKYYTFFFHTRSRLRSYNLGIDKKLMESYTIAITRLCVLIEINNTSEDVFTLAEYLANDLRLLAKMNLPDESTGIFYRLYKNALYAVVQYCLTAETCNDRAGIKFDQLGKRIQLFISVLIEQLNGGQHLFTVSNHVANALCNMLVLTQETDSSQLKASIKQHMMYRVEPEVLVRLSAYIEHYVFGGSVETDEESSCLLARKLMLATYNDVYRLHLALPRQTDTCAIVKYYGENALFADEIEHLLSIVHGKDQNEFYRVVALVVMDYCKKTKFNTIVKKFVSNLQQFARKYLAHLNEKEYLSSIVQNIVDQSLEQVYAVNGVKPNVVETLFNIMRPWVTQLPFEYRKEINQMIHQNPNFATIMEDEDSELRVPLKKFLKSLKK